MSKEVEINGTKAVFEDSEVIKWKKAVDKTKDEINQLTEALEISKVVLSAFSSKLKQVERGAKK